MIKRYVRFYRRSRKNRPEWAQSQPWRNFGLIRINAGVPHWFLLCGPIMVEVSI